VTVAYTLSDAKTRHREWNDDIFDWTYGRSAADRPWNPSRLVDKHRLVVAAMADRLLPWGILAAGKLTYGSGLPRRVVGCPFVGPDPCNIANGGAVAIEGRSPAFKQLDLGVQKRFSSGPGGFMVRVDLLNVFNWTNYVVDTNPFGGVGVAAGQPANSVGLSEVGIDTPTGIRGPERTVKLAASYAF